MFFCCLQNVEHIVREADQKVVVGGTHNRRNASGGASSTDSTSGCESGRNYDTGGDSESEQSLVQALQQGQGPPSSGYVAAPPIPPPLATMPPLPPVNPPPSSGYVPPPPVRTPTVWNPASTHPKNTTRKSSVNGTKLPRGELNISKTF